MKESKLIVIYPKPTDIDAFEWLYENEHVPMAVEKLAGKTRFVASTINTVSGHENELYYRIAEVYFPSLEALNECLSSKEGQETAEHAVSISSGGPPVFLTAEVENLTI